MTDRGVQRTVLITGVSAGIGRGLTKEFLAQGWTVLGTARHAPDLGQPDNFHFVRCDLSKPPEISPAFRQLLALGNPLDLAILNAGILGPFGDLPTHSLEDMQRVMQVNVWANKAILDVLFDRQPNVPQVVTISSGVAAKGYRGFGGYAISKAALNMLTALTAAEHPETHCCALAPGLVDTAMQDQLCSQPVDPKYPSLELMHSRRGTAEMPDGDELASRLVNIIAQLPALFASGTYADLRKPPLNAL